MRKPLHLSEKASGPEPHSPVLSGGQSFQEKFGGPVALESIDAERHVKRMAAIEAGELGMDRVQDEDFDKLIRHANPETKQDRLNLATKLLGQTPAARIVKREIVDVAMREHLARREGRALEAGSIRQLSALDGAEVSPADKIHPLQRVREALQSRRDAGAMFRKLTGFGIGHRREDAVMLLDDDDRPVIKLAPETAQMLGGDRRFDNALKLLKQAHRGDRPENLSAQIAAAVKAAEGGERDKAIGDHWIFEDTADRVAVAEESFAALSSRDVTPAERTVAMLTLTTALAAETMPRERALLMLMDTVPLLGNLRAAEATLESGRAALAAFKRGNTNAGVREAGVTVINALGAIGGLGTPVAAITKRAAVKATMKRNQRLNIVDTSEKRQAKSQGVPEAARQRAEDMANRKFGTQFSQQDWVDFNGKLSELPRGLRSIASNHLRLIIGRSGEYFMHDVIKRWKPKALTGGEFERLRAVEIERGIKQISPELKELLGRLKFSRDGKTVHADGSIPDARAMTFNGRVRLSDLKNENNLPMAAEVKTGGSRSSQNKAYAENADTREKNYGDPQSIDSVAFFKPNQDEWKKYYDESIQNSMRQLISSGQLSNKEASKIRRKLLDAAKVIDMQALYSAFISENVTAIALRAGMRELNAD